MRQNRGLRRILLILLIATVLIAAYFNILNFIGMMRSVSVANVANAANAAPGVQGIGTLLGSIFSWFNIALFVFIIFFFRCKKLNLLWILLPFLGSMIFGMMNLLDRGEIEDESEKTVAE